MKPIAHATIEWPDGSKTKVIQDFVGGPMILNEIRAAIKLIDRGTFKSFTIKIEEGKE